jgi:hypothetical protein
MFARLADGTEGASHYNDAPRGDWSNG